MPPEKHALLGASGAHRWLNCPPSARLEEKLPEETSVYAEEGRLAHAVAELKLRKQFTEPMGPRKFNTALKELQQHPLYQAEMLTHADTYLVHVNAVVHAYNAPPHIALERQLDYSHIVPEGFGTGDCVVIGAGMMHIMDYKYGKGVPVEAEGNPQIRLYALGALAHYRLLYDVQVVHMTILQPRLDSVSTATMSAQDLLSWGESIKPIAKMAFDGKGDFREGEWCRFCRAKAKCRARSNTLLALEAFEREDPQLLNNADIGAILLRAQNLKAWVSDLEDYALAELLVGDDIPGWKAVEGRSTRQFEDVDLAIKVLKAAGYDEAVLYERKPITLTAIEKLCGKKQFSELLTPYIIKPPGKPTLATINDSREAITNITTAREAFGA